MTVTVTDDENPTVTAATDVVTTTSADGTGDCTVDVAITDAVFNDNCSSTLTWAMTGAETATGAGQVGTYTFPIGVTTIIYTNIDGVPLTGTDTITVNVTDDENPTITCITPAASYDVDAGTCVLAITDASFDPAFSDNCSGATVVNNITGTNTLNGASFALGTTNVVWLVTDGAGNTVSCNYDVVVVDNEAPVATCQDITIQLDASGNATITPAMIDNGSSDNCGIGGISVSPNTFTCAEVGTNTVTLTVLDNAGNSTTCTSTVTVEDNILPTAVCQDITVQLDATGNVVLLPSDIDGGSNDNCAPVALSFTSVSAAGFTGPFDPSNWTFNANGGDGTFVFGGTASVTLTGTDAGAAAETELCLTIPEDGNLAFDWDYSTVDGPQYDPFYYTLDGIQTELTNPAGANTQNGSVSIPVISGQQFCFDQGSVDGIMGAGVTISSMFVFDGNGSQLTLDCDDIGANTVPLIITDPSGNVSTCDAIVTVEDNVAPDAICQDITVQLDATGIATIVAADIDNGSTDACGIASTTIDVTSFDCSSVGPNTVTLTVTDVNGNVSTCTSTVTVEDNINPIAICQDITVQLDAAGIATIVAADIDNGSTDACGIASTTIDVTSFDCSNVGPNTVTLTITDINGNTSTCTSTVTVEDNDGPVASCQNITVQLDPTGNATITSADVDGGSSDVCGIANMTLDVSTFDCSNIGVNTVILTVTDNNGNSSTCAASVTVEDNIAPDAVCQDITVQLIGGTYTMAATEIDNGSNDACGIATYTASQTTFGCGDVGVVPVTLTVTDNNGNVSTCVANVTVEDNEAPIATCVAAGTQFALDANGDLIITGAMMDAGSTDDCGIASLTASPSVFTCADLGTHDVTLTVTDNNGNVSTCISNIEVIDNIAPVISCPADISVDAIIDNCGRTVTYNLDVVDACATITQTDGTGLTSGNLFPVGTTVQTYEVTDQTGTYTCTFNVIVNDVQDPIITNCPSNIIVSTDLGSCDASVNWTEPIASDNCPAVAFTSTHSPGDVFALGTTTVTYTATDASGNFVTCSFDVTVNDNEAPVITDCTPDIIVSNDVGNCDAIVTFAAPVYTENCTMGTEVASIVSGSAFPVGTTAVTWTITDAAGNPSTCTFNVTVEDTELPMAVCTDFAVDLDATGNASITASDIDNGSSDNCGIASLALDNTSFDCSNVGPNTVTLTVTDIHGNVSTCTSTVTVNDNLAPTAVCAPLTVQLDATGNASITGADIDGGSTDNCGIASVVASPNAFTCAEVGGNVVTLTVTDVNGNTSTCNTTVTVEDNINPIAICQDITVQLDATGIATIVAADIDNGSTDACGIASTTIDVTSFDCSNVGPNTVTLTVTDVNGNASTCTSTVTVEDNVAPDAICQDITVQLDASGIATIVTSDIDNGSNDACGVASTTIDVSSFDCSMVGANTVTLTVTDVHGNISTCTSTVTVEDNVTPVAVCQDVTVFLDGAGTATIVAADIDGGSTDNCSTISLSASQTAFTCADLGANTVTLTVSDGSGNISSCTATVTVTDTIAPTVLCNSGVQNISDDGTGDCTFTTFAAGQAGSYDLGDNCSDPLTVVEVFTGALNTTSTFSLPPGASYTPVQSFPAGVTNVAVTVTDASGNSSSCSYTTTILDDEAPIAICQDITVQLDATGNASIVPGDIDNGSSDACGIASLALDVTDFTCANIGPNTVSLIVTDLNGNASTCTSIVTVEDNIAPDALCANITVPLDASGNASIVASNIDGGSADACGAVSIAASTTTFDCSNIGPNTVTLTVTDLSGNSSTCNATVTIIDNIAPVLTCPADILVSNDPGLCSASNVAIGVATASDNCPAFVTITNDAPAIFPVGITVITWTGVDGFGNIATCTQNVTVEDIENPIITCPADVTVGNDPGVCEATAVALGTPVVTDNCTPPFSVTITNDAPAVYPVGSTNVTWTATDSDGNVGTCTQVVIVEDTEAPTIICPVDVIVSNTTGICAASGVSLGSPVTNDNCGVILVTNDAPAIFTIGSTTVTWTAVDAAGNSSTCAQIVTVEDTEAPIIACPVDVVVNSDLGSCDTDAIGVVLGTPITNDNCTVASVTNDAPAVFPLGNTTVTWIAFDAAGNSSTCTQIVTVIDVENPTITCPADLIVSADAGSCDASSVILGTPITDDNCTVASVTNDAPPVFLFGSTTVTWTVTDAAGNTATCAQVVTVEDNEAPMIVCPADITVSASGGICSASSVALGTPVTSDNCSVASISNDGLATYPLGTTAVTWTVVDGSGNISTCTQLVTVEDTELPSIVCPADMIISADAGSCDATGVVLGTPVANDNCSVASVTNDAPAAFPLGVTTVTWTVEDGSGNLNTCEQLVTVTDDEAPVIICPVDVTFTADAGSCDATTVVLGTPTATDNCSVASVSNDGLAVYPLGNTIVTWTVVDGSGNTSTCTQIVTVTDDEAPTIACPVDVTFTAEAGVCGSSAVVLGMPITDDNCSVANVTNDAPVLFPVGNTTVTWTVEDGSGNTTTCAQIVTVTDDEAPVVVCSPALTASTDAGVCGATVSLTAPTALDNCGIATITNDAPVLFPVGMTTVTWTVTDLHGNVTTCTQDVTVTDDEAPTVICTPDVFVNSAPGYCGASVIYQTPIFDDNCGIVSIAQTDASGYTSGNLFPVGTTYIEYTAIDNSGNVLTCGFNVTVQDNEQPTLTGCPADITVYTTEAVQCEVPVNWTSPTAADNCPGVNMTQSAYSGQMFPLGITTVTYYVVDNADNAVSCSFNIEVIDNMHPTISMTDELTLVADDMMADSYQWVDCDNAYAPIVGETGSTYTATQNGNFAVIMTIDGCSDTTNCESISTVSIDEFALETLVLYPNPTMTGQFKVEYDGQIERIDIIDMLGRLVSLPVDLEEGLVDGSELANGKYMVRVITEHGMIAKEVIVLK